MKISDKKIERISEQILAYLYESFPKAHFTSNIAKELARDEEFIKKILLELKNKNLIVKISKNPKGKEYLRRARWKLNNSTYNIYKSKQQ